MMLYKDTLDFGFDKEDMEYVVGETKQIENYNTKAILQKIREFDNDELVAAKVYERVDGLKPGDHVDEFFLNAYLLRILDILIYIDNEREILEENETYEVEDDEEIIIATCNELIISLFKKADERKETIKRVIARVDAEVHKELYPKESLDD
ncbi:MAG: hypothetical protein PUE83_03355 [Lachnobacterium sp.]|nr:hypothetical protein [Lachnobacterium sp.]